MEQPLASINDFGNAKEFKNEPAFSDVSTNLNVLKDNVSK